MFNAKKCFENFSSYIKCLKLENVLKTFPRLMQALCHAKSGRSIENFSSYHASTIMPYKLPATVVLISLFRRTQAFHQLILGSVLRDIIYIYLILYLI